MATARERARKTANLAPVDATPEDTARIADAASDVWEPLVRDLLRLAEKYTPDCPNPDCLVCADEHPILTRAKEALDDA